MYMSYESMCTSQSTWALSREMVGQLHSLGRFLKTCISSKNSPMYCKRVWPFIVFHCRIRSVAYLTSAFRSGGRVATP